MRTNKIYSRFIIFSLVFFVMISTEIYPQGTESRNKPDKEGRMYVGFNINPVQTKISNNDFSSDLMNGKGNSANFEFNFGYFFSSRAGISIGAGYYSYSSKLSLDSVSIKYQTQDSENESFEMRIKGESIVETQKISMLSIPLCIHLRFPVSKKIRIFLRPGFSFNVPLSKTFDGNGIFTYDGYYAEYPVLLQNLPEYGLPSDLNTTSSGSLELKSFSTALVASGGMTYSINSKISLLFGLCFSKSLGNISTYSADPDFKLSSKANELNTIMAGSSGAGFQSFGIRLGFNYLLK
ncbi:MAG TPA: outer membrane beta-barrel protein [Bacteroidales bacterium]|nr:outer membrane beta-barrel protein [Bacteroidales bacterium]